MRMGNEMLEHKHHKKSHDVKKQIEFCEVDGNIYNQCFFFFFLLCFYQNQL